MRLDYSLIVAGIALQFLSLKGITGWTIGSGNSFGIVSIIGLGLMIGGIVLFMARKSLEGKLPTKTNRGLRVRWANKFLKGIRSRGDVRRIAETIKKIGEGGPKEEFLSHEDHYSRRVDKGSRVHYTYKNNEVHLLFYEPSSEHCK